VSVASAQTLTFPPLTDRVVDEAGILDATTRASLTEKLAALETKSSDQLVVATVKSLQGTSVEDYANRLFREWKLGQAKTNNGVLLLIAPNERKVRIEVGYGLEGTLTDAISKLIIANSIAPRFRANDFGGGITRGVDDVIQVLTGDAEEWKQRAAQRPEATSNAISPLVIFFVILAILMIIQIVNSYHRPSRFARSRAYRNSRYDPWSTPGWPPDSAGWGSGSGGFSGGDSGGFSGGGGDSGGGGASGSW